MLQPEPPPCRSTSMMVVIVSSAGQTGIDLLRSTHQVPAVRTPRRIGSRRFQRRFR